MRVRAEIVGRWFMVLAALQWGLIGVVGRVAMAESIAPSAVAFWRAAMGALWFGLHAWLSQAAPLRPEDRWRAMSLGVGGVALMYLAYLNSVQEGGVAIASILLYSAPLWVAVGGWLGWGEPLGFGAALPLAPTLLGVVLVAMAPGVGGVSHLNGRALGWGLLSGLTYALYYLMGRPLFARNAPSRVLVWSLAVGAVALVPFTTFGAVSVRGGAALVFLSVFCTFGAYLSYAHGLQRLHPAQAATTAALEPVVALLSAYAFWGEVLTPWALLGALTVVAGVLWSARRAATSGPGMEPATPVV